MNNLMLNFMIDNWSPEEVSLYTEIMETITAVKEDYADNIDVYLMSISDDVPVDTISEEIKLMVQNMLIDLLMNIGVLVTEDYPVDNEVLYRIYYEMITIEASEQTEFSLSILESDKDTVTLFYELLTVVGSLTVNEQDFNTHILKILPQTKDKLINYLRSKKLTEESPDSNVNAQEISIKVKDFIKKINDDNFLVIDLIRKGMNLGMSFHSYINLYKEELFDLDLKEQCYNLYLFALISEEGKDSPAQLIEDCIHNYVFDLGDVDKIIRAIREVQIKTR